MKAPKSKKPARDPAIDAFVLRWGEMGRVWGLPRSAGQIHGLLLAAAEPMSAEEISAALGLARSNVSTSLKELRSLGVIRAAAALGDRAERFAALEDPMDTARAVAAARKAREFDPAAAALREAAAATNGPAGERLAAYADLAEKAGGWAEDAARMPDAALKGLMTLGSGIADLVGSPPAGAAKKKKKKKSA